MRGIKQELIKRIMDFERDEANGPSKQSRIQETVDDEVIHEVRTRIVILVSKEQMI